MTCVAEGHDVGAVVGGTIGALLCLTLIIAAVVVVRRTTGGSSAGPTGGQGGENFNVAFDSTKENVTTNKGTTSTGMQLDMA